MTGVAKFLRITAFGAMTLFGVLGGLFAAGYAFEDPGGWAAVGMTVIWVLPVAALAVLALKWPDRAARVLLVVTGAVVVLGLADALLGRALRDTWGPVTGIGALGLGVALAFLGLHRALLAGVLLVTAALAQLAGVALGFAVHGDLRRGEGPSLGAMLGTSSGVVVVPMLVVGVLFVVAAVLAREPLRPVGPRSA